jgi:hypothetical protein
MSAADLLWACRRVGGRARLAGADVAVRIVREISTGLALRRRPGA